MKSGALAKRRCSLPCATTMSMPSKPLEPKRIVTADPHAYNALKHDYQDKDVPPVEHISQVIAREVKAGKIKFKSGGKPRSVSTPTTIPAISDATTRSTTTLERCWTRFLVCSEWK